MRTLIYFSGITALILIVVRLTGIFLPDLALGFMLPLALVLLVVFLISLFLDRIEHERKIDKIINDWKGKKKPVELSGKNDSNYKGWSMNNSPYRSRRSGLSWGGGNIHAANAKRGVRRGFRK